MKRQSLLEKSTLSNKAMNLSFTITSQPKQLQIGRAQKFNQRGGRHLDQSIVIIKGG